LFRLWPPPRVPLPLPRVPPRLLVLQPEQRLALLEERQLEEHQPVQALAQQILVRVVRAVLRVQTALQEI
jgi:hypothetical protein